MPSKRDQYKNKQQSKSNSTGSKVKDTEVTPTGNITIALYDKETKQSHDFMVPIQCYLPDNCPLRTNPAQARLQSAFIDARTLNPKLEVEKINLSFNLLINSSTVVKSSPTLDLSKHIPSLALHSQKSKSSKLASLPRKRASFEADLFINIYKLTATGSQHSIGSLKLKRSTCSNSTIAESLIFSLVDYCELNSLSLSSLDQYISMKVSCISLTEALDFSDSESLLFS